MNNEILISYFSKKLPDYLKRRGIDVSYPFSCINKHESESQPTMRYSASEELVVCSKCGAKYSIFDLVAIEYKLKDINLVLTKLCEIFFLNCSLLELAVDDIDNTPKSQQNLINQQEVLVDYSSYFKECSLNCGRTDFFKNCGFSEEFIKLYNLGFDEQFIDDNENTCESVIIPNGSYGYVALNYEDSSEYYRYTRGKSQIFNKQALLENKTVFITNTEIEALIFESLAVKALAIGNEENLPELLRLINQQHIKREYYICRDRNGPSRKVIDSLIEVFDKEDLKYEVVDLYFPFNNIFEITANLGEIFKYRLQNISQIISHQPKKLLAKKNYPTAFLQENLLNLNFLSGLYGIVSDINVRVLLIHSYLKRNITPILYVAPQYSWHNLSVNLANFAQRCGQNYYSFIPKIGLSEITSNPKTDARNMLEIITMQRMKLLKEYTVILNFVNQEKSYINEFLHVMFTELKDFTLKVLVFFNEDSLSSSQEYCLYTAKLSLVLNDSQDFIDNAINDIHKRAINLAEDLCDFNEIAPNYSLFCHCYNLDNSVSNFYIKGDELWQN